MLLSNNARCSMIFLCCILFFNVVFYVFLCCSMLLHVVLCCSKYMLGSMSFYDAVFYCMLFGVVLCGSVCILCSMSFYVALCYCMLFCVVLCGSVYILCSMLSTHQPSRQHVTLLMHWSEISPLFPQPKPTFFINVYFLMSNQDNWTTGKQLYWREYCTKIDGSVSTEMTILLLTQWEPLLVNCLSMCQGGFLHTHQCESQR
jgi:hypothetical protein